MEDLVEITYIIPKSKKKVYKENKTNVAKSRLKFTNNKLLQYTSYW